MAFIGLEEALRYLGQKGILSVTEQDILFLYPVKALLTGFALLLFRSRYSEIEVRDSTNISSTLLSIMTGTAVFALWIKMDWGFAVIGSPVGYNPKPFAGTAAVQTALIGSRLAGAVIVVPFMEEIFWRSFFLRYLAREDFMEVPVGQFTWPSFLITVVLFGCEHNFYLAGMAAGAAYNLLLYRTKSIMQCIIAHAVSNLALGAYVLSTGKWQFW